MRLALALLPVLFAGAPQSAEKLADVYVEAVAKLNDEHARDPGEASEEQLAAKLPRKAQDALAKLLEASPDEEVQAALASVARAALDLSRVEDFDAARARLAASSPEAAAALGRAISGPRYLLLGEGGIEVAYLEHFAEVLDAVFAGYDELFGFDEWSKVPGKKLRVRVRLVPTIEQPPHFAPQFPWHSEIDFPVVDAERFASPTSDGKFLFYGLCHELGHVIAMWGDRQQEEDLHTWAHYTGVLLVEHLSETVDAPWMEEVRDVRWRSLELEQERLADVEPGLGEPDAALALWLELHELVGPKAIGDALDALDREDRRLRVNGVRYYRFAELRAALLELSLKKSAKKRVAELLP